jgi:DNA-binding IclR family transcriptional regulator
MLVESGDALLGGNDETQAFATVKSARRVLDILELLASAPRGLSFSQVADNLALPKSSLYSLLRTLTDRHWLEVDEETRRYWIGVRAWEAGQGYHRAADLERLARPYLEEARTELDETVQLAILEGTEVLYVGKVETDRPFKLVSHVGMRLPAYATGLGKVLLAYLPPDELHRKMAGVTLEPFTERTVKDLPELEKRLAAIRRRGFGLDDGEHVRGVCCVAVPVRDKNNNVVAAMSCTIPAARLRNKMADITSIRAVLERHADKLSGALSNNLYPPGP